MCGDTMGTTHGHALLRSMPIIDALAAVHASTILYIYVASRRGPLRSGKRYSLYSTLVSTAFFTASTALYNLYNHPLIFAQTLMRFYF